MNARRITVDAGLVVAVAVVWGVLAAIYQFSPSLGMPGYVRVWGAGAVVFLALAAVLIRSGKRAEGGDKIVSHPRRAASDL